MAQITKTVLHDDLDGSTEDVDTYTFSVQGANFEIELSKENAQKFFKALKPYQDAARKVGSSRSRGRVRASKPNKSTQQVRDWARSSGFTVSERGRISAEIMEAYDKATGRA